MNRYTKRLHAIEELERQRRIAEMYRGAEEYQASMSQAEFDELMRRMDQAGEAPSSFQPDPRAVEDLLMLTESHGIHESRESIRQTLWEVVHASERSG